MEIKEALEILQGICPDGFALVPLISNEKEALQTAISHLETLQRVKEMGGVEKIKNNQSPYDDTYNCGYVKGFNEALDLKDTDMVLRLEGMEKVILNFGQLTSKYPDKRDLLAGRNTFISAGQYEDLTQAIQELILGKKEG